MEVEAWTEPMTLRFITPEILSFCLKFLSFGKIEATRRSVITCLLTMAFDKRQAVACVLYMFTLCLSVKGTGVFSQKFV